MVWCTSRKWILMQKLFTNSTSGSLRRKWIPNTKAKVELPSAQLPGTYWATVKKPWVPAWKCILQKQISAPFWPNFQDNRKNQIKSSRLPGAQSNKNVSFTAKLEKTIGHVTKLRVTEKWGAVLVRAGHCPCNFVLLSSLGAILNFLHA